MTQYAVTMLDVDENEAVIIVAAESAAEALETARDRCGMEICVCAVVQDEGELRHLADILADEHRKAQTRERLRQMVSQQGDDDRQPLDNPLNE